MCLISSAIIPSEKMISATTIRAAITPIIITVKLEPDDPGTSTKTISHNLVLSSVSIYYEHFEIQAGK